MDAEGVEETFVAKSTKVPETVLGGPEGLGGNWPNHFGRGGGFARSGWGLRGQFQSGCRAVTRDAKGVGGRLLAVGNAVGGWCWGVGIFLGQSEGWSLRGEGVPPLPSSDSPGGGGGIPNGQWRGPETRPV